MLVNSPVSVWATPAGVPERVVWNGHRYRVSDEPTLLEPDLAFMTHPPLGAPRVWRFQGTDEQGDSLVFDVLPTTDVHWQLLRVYV